jgi:SAM-dependent methyltransferase
MSRLHAALALIRVREFAMTIAQCPFCGPTLIVRLRDDEIGVRCVRCGASAVHLSIGWALQETLGNLRSLDVCELSARGPLVEYLRSRVRSIATSEYFADAAPGESVDGVRCEDVQRLTYADCSFDLVTHTEVFEHVPQDARAFAQLRRVLKSGGAMIFTVPVTDRIETIERARLRDGVVEHFLPPAFHTDPLRDGSSILVYRDYGTDIVERVKSAGFADVRLLARPAEIPWNMGRRVVVARRVG